jgi:hypothetical protein
VLVAAAMFVANRGPGTPEPAGPTRTDTTLDRCWAAIGNSGSQVSDYPDRSTWHVPLVYDMAPLSDLIAVGISAGDKRFFCEVTATTVSVSWPSAQLHYAEGTQTALMMLTPNGTMAGVIDPSWPTAWFSEPGRFQTREQPRDGMFIVNPGRSLQDAKILTKRGAGFPAEERNEDYSGAELPKPPTLGVSVRDRPPERQDRVGTAGKALGDCLAHVQDSSTKVVIDPDSYGPGDMVTKDGATLVMALSESRLAACAQMPVPGAQDLVVFMPGPGLADIDDEHKVVAYYTGPVNFANGARSTIGGIVPPDIAKVEIEFANGTTVGREIANRTFALVIPDEVEVLGDNKPREPIFARLFTASGALVYHGPVTVWNPH